MLVSAQIGQKIVAQLLVLHLTCTPNFSKNINFWGLGMLWQLKNGTLNSGAIFQDIKKSFGGDIGMTKDNKTAKGHVSISFISRLWPQSLFLAKNFGPLFRGGYILKNRSKFGVFIHFRCLTDRNHQIFMHANSKTFTPPLRRGGGQTQMKFLV